jgi:predicted RNA-binding Zn-ribbon protein involved in translation (DUF1610 family)
MKYTKEMLEPIVKSSVSVSEVLRKLSLKITGGSHNYIKRLIEKFKLDASHFLGCRTHCGQKSHSNKRLWNEILIVQEDGEKREPGYVLRRALIESGKEYKCVGCGNEGIWNNKPLLLQVDHENGNWLDNRPENVNFLCPNCHYQKTAASAKWFSTCNWKAKQD